MEARWGHQITVLAVDAVDPIEDYRDHGLCFVPLAPMWLRFTLVHPSNLRAPVLAACCLQRVAEALHADDGGMEAGPRP